MVWAEHGSKTADKISTNGKTRILVVHKPAGS